MGNITEPITYDEALLQGASCYLYANKHLINGTEPLSLPMGWPFKDEDWAPSTNQLENLDTAINLLIAARERLAPGGLNSVESEHE